MGQQASYIIQIISTFSILPLLLLGIFGSREWPTPLAVFFAFCGFGFAIDLLGWYCYLTNNAALNQVARHLYIAAECCFYFWFIGGYLHELPWSWWLRRAWIGLIPLWAMAIFIDDGIPRFSMSFQVVISFLLSFCLLRAVEKEESVMMQSTFWLLLGSFIYYFCTFFFMNFLYTQFGADYWYIRNIISIVANLLFACGYFVYQRR